MLEAARVFIATTDGPSEIRRIAREDDTDLESVICLDGSTAQALPISPDYDAFVRKPTGIIEKRFGHPVFRLDVSRPITNGRSWQLGVFLAHALLAAGRLAMHGGPAGTAVLATGTAVLATGMVDADLRIQPVDHVADKMVWAVSVVQQARTAGLGVIVFVPRANYDEANAALQPLRAGDPDGLRLIGLDSAGEALEMLGLSAGKVRRDGSKGGRGLAAAAILAAVAGLGWGGYQFTGLGGWISMAAEGRHDRLDAALREAETGNCLPCGWAAGAFRRHLADRTPGSDAIAFEVLERRGDCKEKGDAVRLGPVAPLQFVSEKAKELCSVDYRVVNRGSMPLHLWGVVTDGKSVLAQAEPRLVMPQGDALVLTVENPGSDKAKRGLSVIGAASTRPLHPASAWLTEQAKNLGPDEMAGRLAGLGLGIARASHELVQAAPEPPIPVPEKAPAPPPEPLPPVTAKPETAPPPVPMVKTTPPPPVVPKPVPEPPVATPVPPPVPMPDPAPRRRNPMTDW